MSIGKKILLTIGLTFIGLFVIQYLSSETILLNSFRNLENREVLQQTERARGGLQNVIDTLGTTTLDWSMWDDAYSFVSGGNDGFVTVNVVDSTFVNLRLNLIVFLDGSGSVLLARGFDFREEKETPVPAGLQDQLFNGSPLLCHSDAACKADGILLLPGGPMVLSARPVLDSTGEGPPGGTLIFGRWLDSHEIEQVSALTMLPIKISRFELPAGSRDASGRTPLLSRESPLGVRDLDENSIAGYALLDDIYGKPALVMAVDLPRDIYRQGKTAIFYLMLFLALVTVVFAAAFLFFIYGQVLNRLSLLGKSVTRVAETSDLSIRVSVTGEDELARLASQVNGMLDQLEQAEEKKKKMETTLMQSQKLEAIGTLAGGIAHDFNNLLMGIQGHATMAALAVDPSSPASEDLKYLQDIVKTGANLSQQLLGFARGGRYEVRILDMAELLKKTAFLFGRTKREILIHEAFPSDLWPVMGDRGQMEQVFLNLFVNAWQAMPGGGDLYLAAANVTLDPPFADTYVVSPGRYVKISVTDTGIGMDEKTRKRIFEPFFTTREMGRGTGLGLATVYGIVKGHQGTINVYSEPGKGTTFNVYLPAADRSFQEKEAGKEEVRPGTGTILVVDDEKTVLVVVKRMLENLGYRVFDAAGGSEALGIYREKMREIDLVILDMVMPGMGGEEVFDSLKNLKPDVKVLLSSGYSLNGETEKVFRKGCRGFIQKPFTRVELSEKMLEVLR